MVSAHLLVLAPAVAPGETDLIACVKGVMGGRPVIRGRRITAASAKGRVSGRDSLDDLMVAYPEVTREAFEAAVAFDDRAVEVHPTLGGARRGV